MIGRQRDHRGQALVEFGLLVPLLLLMLMGIIDVGRALTAAVQLEEAIQEGAMYAAFNPASESAIIDRVTASSDAESVADASVTVVCATSPAPGTVVVSADYDQPLITPIISQMFGGSIHLSRSVTATNFEGAC